MNAVLEKMLTTGLADDDPPTPLHSHMDEAEGALIARAFRETRPDVSLEIGLAYGVSTLYACEALAANGKDATHIVLDPLQRDLWHDIGLKNIARAGYSHLVDFRAERSELALPTLLASGTRIQAAIIDGHHTFDAVLVDFSYVNKLLNVGGVVIFDDANWAAIARVMSHISTYPAYKLFGASGMPTPRRSLRALVRRRLAARLPAFRRYWDYPSCMAFQKIAEDRRSFDWHVDF